MKWHDANPKYIVIYDTATPYTGMSGMGDTSGHPTQECHPFADITEVINAQHWLQKFECRYFYVGKPLEADKVVLLQEVAKEESS